MSDELEKEQHIMIMMRKTLASVVRDTTPPAPGLSRGISDDTVEEIRQCLARISERERELAELRGIEVKERPRYADEPRTSNVVSIDGLKKPE
jgi:DNA-directed RNA polymerase specialized sigma24 family protein